MYRLRIMYSIQQEKLKYGFAAWRRVSNLFWDLLWSQMYTFRSIK